MYVYTGACGAGKVRAAGTLRMAASAEPKLDHDPGIDPDRVEILLGIPGPELTSQLNAAWRRHTGTYASR